MYKLIAEYEVEAPVPLTIANTSFGWNSIGLSPIILSASLEGIQPGWPGTYA